MLNKEFIFNLNLSYKSKPTASPNETIIDVLKLINKDCIAELKFIPKTSIRSSKDIK